jgi:hypothetical protein
MFNVGMTRLKNIRELCKGRDDFATFRAEAP